MLAQVCTRVFFFPPFCFSLFRSSEWFYTKEQQEHEALVLKIVLLVAFLFGIKDVYSETIVFSGINRAE